MKATVPTTWHDISIKQFVELYELEQVTDIDPYERIANKVSIACEIPYDTVINVDIKQIKNIANKLSFLDTTPSDTFVNDFFLHGTRYVVNPDIRKITPAQFIDLKHWTTDNTNVMANLHRIATIFCIEDGKSYKDINNEEVANLFYKELPISIIYPIAVFFLRLWKDSLPVILDYSTKEMQKMILEIEQRLNHLRTGSNSSGVGIQS